jgi:hypothetical protein
MNATPDITATVIFHQEGAFVLPALASLRELAETAISAGLVVEIRAVLDRADDLTRHLVAVSGGYLSAVEEISCGDPGLARNAGAASAHGEFLSFLDGDDLWGADWLSLAHRAATAPAAPIETIWHPECVYYFNESDRDHPPNGEIPHPATQSFHMMHGPSDAPEFDRDALLLNNLWTANVFARREVHLRHPYLATDRSRGLGVEDWTWNIATVWAGIPHRVVADTVHLIRVKKSGSLGQRNTVEGLLPRLPPDARLGGTRSKRNVEEFTAPTQAN